MREQSPQPDLDGYSKNGFFGRVQSQILRLEAEGRKARAESFIVIPRQGIWRRMGHRTFYRLFGLHYISEEDDPITKGIQAAINRAHSKIFIKDGTYLLSQNVQYPTSLPNSPSALWYDFPKAIVLEGESNDTVIQLLADNKVQLFTPNDNFVNTPYLALKTLQIEGVGEAPNQGPGTGVGTGFVVGGGKYGYYFFWDVTMKNVQAESTFGVNYVSLRNYRIINTQVGGPTYDPGGFNFSTTSQGSAFTPVIDIDGYYVLGFYDNALAFNGGGTAPSMYVNAKNIFIFAGNGITPNEWAIVFATPPGTTATYNANLDNIITNWHVAIGGPPNLDGTVQDIYIGRIQVAGASTGSVGLQLGTVNNLHIDTLIINNGYISANSGNITNCTIRECDLTWSNPNIPLTVVSPLSFTQTGPMRFGKLTVNILQQPSGAAAQLVSPSFGGTDFAFTVDVDELDVTVASGAGTFALNNVTPGTRVGRAKINGVPQPFPPNIIPNPPASGVTYLNNNAFTVILLIPVALTPTSTAAASASIAVGTSPSTLSTVQTLTQAAGAGPTGGVLQAAVPQGQYYQITLTNATAYQAIVLPE